MLGWLKKLFGAGQKKTEQASSSAKPKRHEKNTVSVTVGLDFGTSSTKCVINLEEYDKHQDKFLVIIFPSQEPSRMTLCIPTSIAAQRNCLLFGELAEKLPENQVIRSFKMAIPCIDKDWGNYRSASMMPDKPGYFDIQGHPFSATKKLRPIRPKPLIPTRTVMGGIPSSGSCCRLFLPDQVDRGGHVPNACVTCRCRDGGCGFRGRVHAAAR